MRGVRVNNHNLTSTNKILVWRGMGHRGGGRGVGTRTGGGGNKASRTSCAQLLKKREEDET